MKVKTVSVLAAGAMMLTSLTVWSVTPEGGFSERALEEARTGAIQVPSAELDSGDPWNFSDGTTLTVAGRLGHRTLQSSRDNESYVYVDVAAPAGATASGSTPVNLAIVIDRSGSMRGKRLRNAIDAARGMVRRLRDGDVVSVVSYNTRSETLVRDTTISASSREQVIDAIAGISAGGDTCISCGIDAGMRALEARQGMVNRMLLLSDGQATAGVRDVEGFRRIATRARTMGCSISSVGVDVDYNERIMAAVAQGSNGRHYFVENAAGLPSIFDQELQSLVRTVAKAGELRIELAPGVQLAEVFDRAFRREGNTIVVPMGSFSAGDNKTVLARVRIPRGAEGQRAVADVRFGFDDLVDGGRGSCEGKLSAALSSDPSAVSELDPLVLGRLGRSETASTLRSANQAFALGNLSGAREQLNKQRTDLARRKRSATRRAPKKAKGRVAADFDRQLAALDEAESGFATPPSATIAGQPAPAPQQSRAGRANVRRNESSAVEFGF
jgi:Ca-activated chloride channel family protein